MRSIGTMWVGTFRQCIGVGFLIGALFGVVVETATQFDASRAIAAQLLIKR